MNIEKIKDIILTHRTLPIVFLCVSASFAAGYIIGQKGEGMHMQPTRRQINYSTNTDKKPAAIPANNIPPMENKTQSTTVDTDDCTIKGNIGSGGKKTYHVRGGSFYERTNAEMCFDSEEEALSAGFTKSSR